jgi:heme/copper-type cytochrome/quinol oxidase subunit 2
LKCPLNCIACSYSYQTVELICDACQSGSSLQNNSCIQSPSSNTDNIGSTSISTISIVIPIISVFLLCLFIYIVWRRCKRRQPLPEAPREIPLNSLGSRSAINIENLGRM